MAVTLSAATITRLEKVAVDNGFDQELPGQDEWLGFASTHVPLELWLSAIEHGPVLAALSRLNVARALADQGSAVTVPLPSGACAALATRDIADLHRLVRRAFQLSKTLPDELLCAFQKQTANLPRTTEVERLAVQRVGQDLFRDGLLEYWDGRCAITGLAVHELLRASHIKPWADCETDAERLDVFNGLLLAPHLDAAFDQGFITVADDGSVIVSPIIGPQDRSVLGLDTLLRVRALRDDHRVYMQWHGSKIFKHAPSRGEEAP